MKNLLLLFLCLRLFTVHAQIKTPLQSYPQLYRDVEMGHIYADSKTFADAVALKSAAQINTEYLQQRNKPDFNLRAFVYKNFKVPVTNSAVFKTDIKRGLRLHIDTLWSVLKRSADTVRGTSLIPLPYSYVVPGGRFREVYYWDSYFTMLGLQQDHKLELIRHMVDNFAWLLDNYGLIPNGNRTYYLTRSQPPFFALMVKLLAQSDKDALTRYRPELLKEYDFWMKGAATLKPGTAYKHVVKLADGVVLNRYWDDSDQPREESYREDVLSAAQLKQGRPAFYRNVRAAAESGWDFSSRWFRDGRHLINIQTTDLIPVDLNCLLYNLENTIAQSYRLSGNARIARVFENRATRRKQAIMRYCWSSKNQCFTDYNWRSRSPSPQITVATAFPLFFKVASPKQADLIASLIKSQFLQAGGVATTLKATGEQWDRPNGWAPLQYITIEGLKKYGKDSLAKVIAMRWIKQNTDAFNQIGKLLEKYNVELKRAGAHAGGGEYPLQDGFGWTNGVLLTLMNEYHVK